MISISINQCAAIQSVQPFGDLVMRFIGPKSAEFCRLGRASIIDAPKLMLPKIRIQRAILIVLGRKWRSVGVCARTWHILLIKNELRVINHFSLLPSAMISAAALLAACIPDAFCNWHPASWQKFSAPQRTHTHTQTERRPASKFC